MGYYRWWEVGKTLVGVIAMWEWCVLLCDTNILGPGLSNNLFEAAECEVRQRYANDLAVAPRFSLLGGVRGQLQPLRERPVRPSELPVGGGDAASDVDVAARSGEHAAPLADFLVTGVDVRVHPPDVAWFNCSSG
jgi:hypothetical protein